MKKQNKLKTAILEILKDNPKSRDSDQYLTLCIWNRYFPDYIFKDSEGKPAVTLEKVMLLPREDSIKRLRAFIQNEEHKYLPTTLEVAKKRKINEAEWKSYIISQKEYLN